MGFSGSNSNNHFSYLLRHSSGSDGRNRAYQKSVQKIELGSGVTSIGSYAFYHCYSLASIVIPDGVTSIGSSAFSNCYGIRYYDFTKHTSVPALANFSAFNAITSDCEIRVPAALYDEWKAATNWAAHKSKIVAV